MVSVFGSLFLIGVGCAAPAEAAILAPEAPIMPADAPTLEIPSYAADDPRTQSPGFVREVRLAEVVVDETKFILMAFVVGEVLTLGAMTEGEFEGVASWMIGGRAFEVEFVSGGAGEVPVRVVPGIDALPLTGSRAGFRGFHWINVELEAETWLPAGEFPVRLEFHPRTGSGLSLPERGVYRAERVTR